MVTIKVYDKIKHLKNASPALDLLVSVFKLKGAGFINDAFRWLNCLILKDYINGTDYIIKFHTVVNKLWSFWSKIKIDNNFFIYNFQSNLGLNHTSHFERYAEDHDPFNTDKKPKYSLSLTIQQFWNTIKNPFAKSSISLEIAAIELLLYLYTSYLLSNTTHHTQKIYFKNSASNKKITKVKWCIFC